MKNYVLVSFGIWVILIIGWMHYGARPDSIEITDAAHKQSLSMLSTDTCRTQVVSLITMQDKFLKAGGPEVPAELRNDIELCLSSDLMDPSSRSQMQSTKLMRLFPTVSK